MKLILKYFPDLSSLQIQRLERLEPLYRDWNEKINLISRKDIDNLYEHHVLHSLAIAKVVKFKPTAEILDIGTGGGFPGIPLAILFPSTKFTLVDGTLKKIKVVREVANSVGLKNVEALQIRAEELKKKRFDFVVCRAVAPLEKLLAWSARLIKTEHQHLLPNGLLALKGGEAIQVEINALPKGEYVERFPISDFFDESYFAEKEVLYAQG